MILLEKQKIIFLKARKVAGTSFEIALSKYASAGDVITPISEKDEKQRQDLGFRSPQNYHYKLIDGIRNLKYRYLINIAIMRRPIKFFNHISAEDAKRLIGEPKWNEYTKIAIVRNPYDYAVSSYFWSKSRSGNIATFDEWCKNNTQVFGLNHKQYFIDGCNIIDFFIRFENFEEDIGLLESRYSGLDGIYRTFTTINAKSGIRPQQSNPIEMFQKCDFAKKQIEMYNQFEIMRFGYNLD